VDGLVVDGLKPERFGVEVLRQVQMWGGGRPGEGVGRGGKGQTACSWLARQGGQRIRSCPIRRSFSASMRRD
jgi:hypothetical protein